MSKISDIITLANTLSDNLGTLAVDQKALNDDVVSLASEDPCAAGFGDKLTAANEKAGVLNSQFSTYKTQLSSLVAKYNDLGILDFGNKQEASDAIDAATKAITAINSIAQSFDGPAKRAALSASLAACPVNATAGETPTDPQSTNADPGANVDANKPPPGEGDNKVSDDNPETDETTSPPNDTTTSLGTVVVTGSKQKKEKPGIRTKNPLSNFSSYTYQLTLYMITPDAYQAFILSDRTKINAINNTTNADAASAVGANGAYIVAQSGGVNNSTAKRAPGMNLDYYIDDLKITSAIASPTTKTETNVTDFEFKIYEPYGFSFVTQLRNAVKQLTSVTKSKQFAGNIDPIKQFFVLGIRFRGYDKDGNVLTGNEHFAPDTNNPVGNNNGVFERFYDIKIKTFKFKLDGKTTVYSITAGSLPIIEAASLKRGTVDKETTITAPSIEKACEALAAKMNSVEQEMLDKDEPDIAKANTYKIEFVGDCTDLKAASLLSRNNLDKVKWPDNPIKNTKDVNPKLEVTSVPNSTESTIKIVQGTPLLQAISDMVKNSTYLSDAMKVLDEANSEGGKELPNSKPKILRWFNVSPNVVCTGWDEKRRDYTYDITYIIQAYETPAAVALGTKGLTPYYGPHKRYEYLFTGQNTEVISYEHHVNALYHINVLNNPGLADDNGAPAGIPIQASKPTGISSTGSLDEGLQAAGPFLTSLYDTTSYADAKIQILGDPDYLMQTSTGVARLNDVYSQFYGADGFTINPNGGQVFIEVNFKEARDYNNQTGYMEVNDSVYFWPYPADANVKGVSFQVRLVTSTFSKGKFTQLLNLNLNQFPDFKKTNQTDSGRENQSDAETARLARQNAFAGGVNTAPAGPVAEEQATNNTAAGSLTPDTAPPNNTITSPTGGTSDQPPSAASIIANSPIIQASQSVPVNREVADGDATGDGNSTTTTVDQGGRED